ncbi:hypothetical protein AB4144_17535 [Rhizobiaceae sp. 2RAB30]
MPELHKHGLELVVDLLDAVDQLGSMPPEDARRLLRDAADCLGDLLKRDDPHPLSETPEIRKTVKAS